MLKEGSFRHYSSVQIYKVEHGVGFTNTKSVIVIFL